MATDKDKFYEVFARHLNESMKRENITVTDLVKKSGEQNKTIKGILQGRRFSAHHFVWLMSCVSLDLEKILEELSNGDEKIKEESINSWI